MEEVRFEDLGLCPEIMRAVKKMGFEEASPIQAKAIPVMMSGCDLIGQAQTGTGKTAAFGIPLLEKIEPKNKKLQAIVLCPTRELAIQVAEEIRHLAYYMHGIKVLPIYGGQEIVKQIRRGSTDYRNARSGDGSYAAKNYKDGESPYGRAGRGGRNAEYGISGGH